MISACNKTASHESHPSWIMRWCFSNVELVCCSTYSTSLSTLSALVPNFIHIIINQKNSRLDFQTLTCIILLPPSTKWDYDRQTRISVDLRLNRFDNKAMSKLRLYLSSVSPQLKMNTLLTRHFIILPSVFSN